MLPSALSSTLRRALIAACAVLCLFAFAAPASAGPLCGGVSGPSGDDWDDDADGICRNFSPGDNAKYFLFDAGTGFDHLVRITVNTVVEEFGLRIVRNLIAPGPIPGFPEYTCVGYGIGGDCVEYTTRHPINSSEEYHPETPEDYLGPIVWLISWIQPVGTDPIPEIFHELGEEDPQDPEYDEIMEGIFFSATQGPYDFNCDNPDNTEGAPNECDDDYEYKDFFVAGDPVRVALSDSFSSAIVGQAVPEPATAALFVLMGTACAVRLRRRNR